MARKIKPGMMFFATRPRASIVLIISARQAIRNVYLSDMFAIEMLELNGTTTTLNEMSVHSDHMPFPPGFWTLVWDERLEHG